MKDSYQISFENEYVRIVHVSIAAGQEPPSTRSASPWVRIDLDTGKTSYVDSTSQQEHTRTAHQASREIRVELKAAPPANPLALDAVRVDPARYKVDFENDRV